MLLSPFRSRLHFFQSGTAERKQKTKTCPNSLIRFLLLLDTVKENPVACQCALWICAARWDPGGKRLNFFSGKHCWVYGGGRKAHTNWQGILRFSWMKCCEYESVFGPSRLRFRVCDAHGDHSEPQQRRNGTKWWKSCADRVRGSGGWGRTCRTNSQSFRSQVTDSKSELK